MKKFGWLLGCGILLSIAAVVFWEPLKASWFPQRRVIEIALMGPLSGAKRVMGEAMRRGAQLYLDHVNYKEMLGGRTIHLQLFNDQDNSQIAAKRAADLAAENRVLLVLGHLSSDPTLAASEIYQKNGIPAITASATDDAITRGNEWYFRTIPSNSFQGTFIAQYVKNILRAESTSMIVDQDSYGASLAKSYAVTAQQLGLKMIKRWEFDHAASDLEQRLKTITGELHSLENPGVIFFATSEVEAIKLITAIKLPGTNYTIIGPDAFASVLFLKELQQYPQEQVQPGYYSDGVYAFSPFIAELAAGDLRQFRQDFRAEYGEEPTWEAACYYDAMAVVVGAMQRAELDGQDLRSDRKKVQEALAGIANADVAIPGITGALYFDQERNMPRPLAVGIYARQYLQAASTQYHRLAAAVAESSRLKDGLEQAGLQIDELKMAPDQAVSAGIDVNKISRFDVCNATYTADFYLWFRFREDFQDQALIFLNAAAPITLRPPIFEKKTPDGLTVRAYHVQADFKTTPNFAWYPFEQPVLPITFRHANYPSTRLRYVPDVAGLTMQNAPESVENVLNPAIGWNVAQVSNYVEQRAPASPATVSKLKQPLPAYSQFTAAIRLTRSNGSFVVKNFGPLLSLLILLYLVYFLPVERLGLRSFLLLAVLAAALFVQLMLHRQFLGRGLVIFDVGFFTVELLGVLAAGLSLAGYRCHKQHAAKMAVFLNRAGKCIHPIFAILVGLGLLMAYITVSQKLVHP